MKLKSTWQFENNQNIHDSAPVSASLSFLISSGCSVGDAHQLHVINLKTNQTQPNYIYLYVYMCCPISVCVCVCVYICTKKQKLNKRPGSINGSHSFYRSLCVAQIVAKAGRAHVDPPSLWGKRLILNPSKYISCGWTFQTGEEREPMLRHPAVARKKMPEYLWPPPVAFQPLKRVPWDITCTHSYNVRRLSKRDVLSGLFRSMTSRLLLFIVSCTDSIEGLLALVYECDLRLVWLVPDPAEVFPDVRPVPSLSRSVRTMWPQGSCLM